MEYNYDEEAQFFPFFVLTVTSLVTVPLTYTLLRRPADEGGSRSKHHHIETDYQPKDADLIDTQRAKQKRKERRTKRILTVATGWLVMAYMVYLMVVTARNTPKIWNPYDILDVSLNANEKQINSRYRRLSITMHPDKRKPDPVKNETIEAINDEWVEIVKAYKALTDEEIRNNFLQYGNPDGRQSTSFGIALPQFLVAEGSGKYVLLFYGMLLGVGLPWLVGKWWYGMQKMTRERILVTSAGNMLKEYRDKMEPSDTIAAVSTAVEHQDILHGGRADSGLSSLEKKLLEEDASTGMPEKEKNRLRAIDDSVRRKALALTWAYLARLELGDRALEADKYEIPPTALQMNEAFVAICLAYGNTAPVLASYHLSQSLVQAIPPTKRLPLLQLPHFTQEIIQKVEASTQTSLKSHLTVQGLMDLPTPQRQSLCQNAGLTSSQLKQAETVARQLPYLRVERTFFKVQGEKYILPSSLIQFVIKARVIPPGTTPPAIKASDLEDIDPDERDLIKSQKEETPQNFPPLAYAPYFAKERAPRWHVFLADTRQGKIAVPPFTFASFDKPPFDEKTGQPTFEVVTLKMQFQAPPQPGEYKFIMNLCCDSYVGFDHRQEVTMRIEDASKAKEIEEVEEEDDISEPEEDSIAGAMATLKGQPTADPNAPPAQKAPTKRRLPAKKAQKDEESDYESDTDDDQDESESETDTDTDTDEE
ncbi:hypothetical protein MBLNU230_g8279t1 [Neophaeotheca triangularis]